jgi:arginase family enzyme
MSELEFLKPINSVLLNALYNLATPYLGKKVIFHSETEVPDLDKIEIAILGVLENRGEGNENKNHNLDDFRMQLYSLFPGNWSQSIADLGDLLPGETLEDTYFALKEICAGLIRRKIIPIVIGGTQDLTYAIYRSYDSLEQMVNLAVIDNKFDLMISEKTHPKESYLNRIILEEPNNLFSFSNIGYQTYFNSQEQLDLLEKLYFDAFRLGEIIKDHTIAEPILRDADIVSFDMNAVKSETSGNLKEFNPNGFDGIQICTLARYSGISDKVSCFSVFNHQYSKNESILLSQIVWYFIEGVHLRSQEYPFGSHFNYFKYIVPIEDEELIFYKSDKTDRWWIEIPKINKNYNNSATNSLLPCSKEDYLAACNQEYPERYWKAQRKQIV